MRLGQLSRQISVPMEKICSFLASRDVIIQPDGNAKIDDVHASMVVAHFSPGQAIVQAVEVDTPMASEASEPSVEASDSDIPTEPTELIKAPKVELPGLRIVGKIELPEKKKKDPQPEETAPRPQRTRDERPLRKQGWRNPVAAERAREERERQEKLEEQRRIEKEKKTRHYQSRLKPQSPIRPARFMKEDVDDEVPEVVYEQPKTWWGRMVAWLNGR